MFSAAVVLVPRHFPEYILADRHLVETVLKQARQQIDRRAVDQMTGSYVMSTKCLLDKCLSAKGFSTKRRGTAVGVRLVGLLLKGPFSLEYCHQRTWQWLLR